MKRPGLLMFAVGILIGALNVLAPYHELVHLIAGKLTHMDDVWICGWKYTCFRGTPTVAFVMAGFTWDLVLGVSLVCGLSRMGPFWYGWTWQRFVLALFSQDFTRVLPRATIHVDATVRTWAVWGVLMLTAATIALGVRFLTHRGGESGPINGRVFTRTTNAAIMADRRQ